MSDPKKLSPELRRRLIAALKDPAGARRQHQISHFQNVETMVARMDGFSDEQAAQYFQMMLDDADPWHRANRFELH